MASGVGALLSAQAHAGGVAFSGRITAGCDELAQCQALEAEAERRAAACVVFCGRAAAEHRAARLMRYRAEERQAVRDHYRAREHAEQLERERERAQALDERQRRDSARAQEAAREQQERLALEQLRQAHVDRRLSEERQRRVGYYVALGGEGRARRLERCLQRNERCDALAIDLLDAAADDAERQLLAKLNERLTSLPAKTVDPVDPSAASQGAAPSPRDAEHDPKPAPRDARPAVEVDRTAPPSAVLPSS